MFISIFIIMFVISFKITILLLVSVYAYYDQTMPNLCGHAIHVCMRISLHGAVQKICGYLWPVWPKLQGFAAKKVRPIRRLI